ncbi:hypothetical protein Tco_1539756, partial [Tanacetum coccineum]
FDVLLVPTPKKFLDTKIVKNGDKPRVYGLNQWGNGIIEDANLSFVLLIETKSCKKLVLCWENEPSTTMGVFSQKDSNGLLAVVRVTFVNKKLVDSGDRRVVYGLNECSTIEDVT